MKIDLRTHTSVTIDLGREGETYRESESEDRGGSKARPFRAQRLTVQTAYNQHDVAQVLVSGSAIKTDGTIGLVDRSRHDLVAAFVEREEVPAPVREAVAAAARQVLRLERFERELQAELSDRARGLTL